ncbi:MAG: hypothetical protein KGQ60_04100 [Planctomycetes bacterium]|nr:hypothetical protein [Planctomycetota bacterium]
MADNPVITAMLELVDSLNKNRINYVMMGGLAVRALAIPRPTNDVDITIDCSALELESWLKGWDSATIQVPEIYLTGWLDRVADMPLVKLKAHFDKEHAVDLDIFVCETEFQRSMMSRRIQAQIDEDQSVWIASTEDLILLKLIANRPRDWIDIADVLFVQGSIDETYLERWANLLGVRDRLQKALAKDHRDF